MVETRDQIHYINEMDKIDHAADLLDESAMYADPRTGHIIHYRTPDDRDGIHADPRTGRIEVIYGRTKKTGMVTHHK